VSTTVSVELGRLSAVEDILNNEKQMR
jgi:hypothetical protein